MGSAVKFGGAIKELRLHLCQNSSSSKGVREFIEKFYVQIKKSNPSFPFLIRECEGIQPKLWARYGGGKETCLTLTNNNAEQILGHVQGMANKC